MPTNLSPSRVIAILASFLLSAIAVLAQAQITFSDDRMPGGEHPGWLVSLVVDDLTGEPIAGAEVFLVAESPTPLAGEFWFSRKVVTDARGILRMPTEGLRVSSLNQVLRHPDYGTCTRGGREEEVWRVGRAVDLPVLVLDWRGQPTPGARIGFCGGCGHCPDLANATADENGIAVLRGVDPHNHIADIYVQHPGLGLGYDSVNYYPGGPQGVIECAWSLPLSGRVIDHLGKPVAAAFVASPDVHRGPWSKTNADGAFTILGGDPAIGAYHVLTEQGRKVYFKSPRSYPVTLQLPDLSDPEAHQGTMDVEDYWQKPVVLTRKIRVRFETSGELVTATTRLPGSPSIDGVLDTVEVPTHGPFAIVLSTDEYDGQPRNRGFAFADVSELPPEPVVLRWYSPTTVVGRVVDQDGAPVAVDVCCSLEWTRESGREFSTHPDGTFALQVTKTGLGILDVRTKVEGLRSRVVWVPLPLRGDDRRVDLGDIVLSSEPQLRIVEADGPMTRGTVGLARAGYQQGGESRSFVLDHEGCWDGPDLRSGDCLVVEREDGVLPWRALLRGPGPWHLEPPMGQLDLRVTTADGKLIVPHVTIRDHNLPIPGVGKLRGLVTGQVRCFVSAPGYRTAIVEADITAEPQLIEVTLPLR